jgi:hypothetical protein
MILVLGENGGGIRYEIGEGRALQHDRGAMIEPALIAGDRRLDLAQGAGACSIGEEKRCQMLARGEGARRLVAPDAPPPAP